MVAVIQTFASTLKWNSHIHSIVTRGVFLDDGSWHPIPYVDAHRAELVFRHKVLGLLRDRGLITHERINLLLSWCHSGFTVHNQTTVYPSGTEGLHRLACYLMRAPVNLSRLRFDADSALLVYEPKAGHDVDDAELIDPLEFLARVLIHIPEPNKHLVRFCGAYANRVRSETIASNHSVVDEPEGIEEAPPQRRAMRQAMGRARLPYLRGRDIPRCSFAASVILSGVQTGFHTTLTFTEGTPGSAPTLPSISGGREPAAEQAGEVKVNVDDDVALRTHLRPLSPSAAGRRSPLWENLRLSSRTSTTSASATPSRTTT